MRIDSTAQRGSDSLYYPFHTPRRTGYWFAGANVFDSTGASWLGKQVVKKIDGTFLFDNMWGDTVKIKTLANVGDSWIFFDDTTDFSYIASVTLADTMTILGVLDSVKTITITADSAGIANPHDPVNNFKILLSKNCGFVHIFDLYTFPYHYPDSFFNIRHMDYYLDLLLGNLGEGDLGFHIDNQPDSNNSIFHLVNFHNPRMNEIFSFSIGDVFESSRHATNLNSGDFSITTTIDTVTSKSPIGTDTAYQYEEHSDVFSLTTSGTSIITTSSYSHILSGIIADTTYLVNMSRMPEEWRADNFYHYFQYPFVASACYSPASYWVNLENIYYDGNAITGIGTDGFQVQFSNHMVGYKIGYGIDTVADFSAVLQTNAFQQQFFAHKSGINCLGTVWPITKVNELSQPNPEINLAPNPVSSFLTIKTNFKEGFWLTLSNLIGQEVIQMRCINSDEELNVSHLANGVYVLTIYCDNGFKVTKQLVIAH